MSQLIRPGLYPQRTLPRDGDVDDRAEKVEEYDADRCVLHGSVSLGRPPTFRASEVLNVAKIVSATWADSTPVTDELSRTSRKQREDKPGRSIEETVYDKTQQQRLQREKSIGRIRPERLEIYRAASRHRLWIPIQ